MERVITEFEERIYRLRHQDFEGLTTIETAKQLKISEACVRHNLRNLEKKCPQLFPILTQRQALIRNYIIEGGYSHEQIAILLDISKRTVGVIVATLKKKGVCFERPHRTERYEGYLDNQIRKKF